MKKVVSLLLIVCLAITLLAGCSGNANPPAAEQPTAQETGASQTDAAQNDAAESAPAAKKTMVIGDTTFNSENWEETVDPHRTYNGWACIRYGIGETLVHYTDSMELEPWLAKSWENDGNLTWTITLQDNVTFSSGRKMDAEAVKQCFEHLLENHDRAPGDTKIADMQADGQILTITTSEPNPALMNYLGDPYGCIIDVDASDFDAGIVAGTGPYVVADMVTDDHLTLTKNENYWNGTPKINELTIRTLSNGDTLSAALQAGDIDAAYGMAYEAYPNFENGNYQFSSIQTSRAFFASMNMTSPIIQDAAVRKAIAMGIDKQGFVSALLDGHGVPGNGAFPDGFATFGGENVTTETYDPEGAKAGAATVKNTANIGDLITELPDYLEVDLKNNQINVKEEYYTVQLGRDYHVDADYSVFVPFEFDRGLKVVYNDSTESMHSDLKDLSATGTLEVMADAYNTIPLELLVGLKAVDVDGNEVPVEFNTAEAHVAPGDGSTYTMNGEVKQRSGSEVMTPIKITAKLDDKDLLSRIDKLCFNIHADATGSNKLVSTQYLKLNNIKIKLHAGVIADFN